MADTMPITDVAVTIRPYRPTDHQACRALWGQLVEEHRRLYADPSRGGDDSGAGFEDYLTRLDLSGMWVADHAEEGVVGFVGLVLGDEAGNGVVDPVVVSEAHRHQGIGRALLGRVAAEARRRQFSHLTISPASRNLDAIRCLHSVGYTVLSSVTLTLDVGRRTHEWRDGLELHDLRFSY
ncbi:MAG TPA: GNAT family N-acetyltransferase [Micromonosporaceae bacterium]